MRPDVYFDRYKRYKNGTNEIALWLASTAKEQHIKFARAGKKTYILPLDEFSRLATAIASGLNTTVPSALINSLKDVLFLRKEASQYFQRQSRNDEIFRQENENHLHVISVLENVLDALSPLCGQTSEAHHEDGATSDDQFTNLFEALELEETEETLSSPDLVQQAYTRCSTAPTANATYVAPTTESDLPFAIFCFYKDLNDIRGFLRETWEQYKRCEIGLMSASITTDVAFEMVKQKEQEFLGSIKVPQELVGKYIGQVLFDFSANLGKDASSLESPDTSLYSLAEFVYLPNYVHLKQSCNLMDEFEAGPSLSYSFLRTVGDKGQFTRRGEILDMATMSMYILHVESGHNVAADAFLRGISALIRRSYDQKPGKKTKMKKGANLDDIPAWLCFASQIYIDLHDILVDDMPRAFHELKLTGSRALGIVTRHLSFHEGRYESSWPKHFDDAAKDVQELVNNFITRDELRTELVADQVASRHTMLSLQPIWCGVVMFQINKTLEGLGMHCANTWNTVTPLMYLYDAAKCEAKISDWADMEYLIHYHDPTYLFVGGRPTRTDAHFNKYLIAMGGSAVNFSKGKRRDKRMVTSRGFANGARYLRQNILVSHRLGWRYMCPGANIDLEQEPSLMAILMGFARKPTTALVRAKELEFPTSVQLLASLRDGLDIETEHILFDYFSFHRRCFNLCYDLQSALHENLSFASEILPGDYNSEELVRQVPALILQMLSVPRHINRRAKNLLGMLSAAAPVIETLIKKEGDHEIKRMRSIRVDMEALTADLAKLMGPDARPSDFLSAGNGSFNLVDVMRQMSASTGGNSDDLRLMGDLARDIQHHPAIPTMKDSEENGIREINELLISMGRKSNAEEMLKKDPMGLMKIIMSEELGGPSMAGATGHSRLPFEESGEAREWRREKNRTRNQKRKQKKKVLAEGNADSAPPQRAVLTILSVHVEHQGGREWLYVRPYARARIFPLKPLKTRTPQLRAGPAEPIEPHHVQYTFGGAAASAFDVDLPYEAPNSPLQVWQRNASPSGIL
ncbi:hypothetical protein GQ44DRAFT_732531 [Phaeosphaeriaceae sp. PMI808]|nr:hypothetical protein GQ44DRAFT_732531 [Phaeosphaeriaceae sp. PMI808]